MKKPSLLASRSAGRAFSCQAGIYSRLSPKRDYWNAIFAWSPGSGDWPVSFAFT